MFFIAPRNEPPSPEHGGSDEAYGAAGPPTKRKRLFRAPDDFSGYYPKRVSKACDRCRLKKVRCSGGRICARCEADAVVCVTSSVTAKDLTPISPEQLHLVESQRDRLVQILSKILQRQDPAEAANLREILTGMGLSMQSLSGTEDTNPTAAEIDATSFDQVPQDLWLELYENLGGHDQNPSPLLSAADRSMGIAMLDNNHSAPENTAAIQDQQQDGTMQFDDMVRWNSFDTSSQQDGSSYHNDILIGTPGDHDLHDGSLVTSE